MYDHELTHINWITSITKFLALALAMGYSTKSKPLGQLAANNLLLRGKHNADILNSKNRCNLQE